MSHAQTEAKTEKSVSALERHILIVEHDSQCIESLQQRLAQAGFRVSTLAHAEQARTAIERDQPDLVVMNWDMPTVVAMDLVQHIKGRTENRETRLIALSSFASEQHVCSGFELGVDDYVIKPFSVSEVVARVRAVLRPKLRSDDDTTQLAFRGLQMDTSTGRVTVSGRPVLLRNMEFRLLEFLMRSPERAFSRATLLRQVWGMDSGTKPRAVDVTMQRIRRALRAAGYPGYLQTIRGHGYRLSVDP